MNACIRAWPLATLMATQTSISSFPLWGFGRRVYLWHSHRSFCWAAPSQRQTKGKSLFLSLSLFFPLCLSQHSKDAATIKRGHSWTPQHEALNPWLCTYRPSENAAGVYLQRPAKLFFTCQIVLPLSRHECDWKPLYLAQQLMLGEAGSRCV